MRALRLACGFSIVLATLLLDGRAFAQGCDLAVVPVDFEHECNGIDVPESYCGGSGTPGYYCYMGYGECSADHYQYTSANIAPDTSCETWGCCNGSVDCSKIGNGGSCNYSTCGCDSVTPVLIDTTGHGFHLTSAENGVLFDILADGHPIKISWTAAGSGNAFLALDRNHNGVIDSGKELFGNVTEQPKSPNPNGFLALAEFDKPENGGNGDGIIDKRDAVFSHLLLWVDENHDGISQQSELHTLPELGVFSLSFHYREDKHFFDQYGNWFHYQAAVNPDPGDGRSKDGRLTYDVFLVVTDNQPDALALQSRVPHVRMRQWELSLANDLPIAPLRAAKTGCRPRPQQVNSGGSQ
jgi:hypothetical protein